MKTNVIFTDNFESAKTVINETKSERLAWYQKERTLSNLLHKAQTKGLMPYTKPIFAKAGLPIDGKLSKTKFLTYVVNFVEVKGEKLPAYINETTAWAKDENGKLMKDAEGKRVPQKNDKGEIIKRHKLTAIKEGTWTLEKLIKSVAKN